MNYYLCNTCSCEWEGNKIYAKEKCPTCGLGYPIILVGKTQKEYLNELILTTTISAANWSKDAFGKKVLNKLITNCTL